MTPRPAYRFDEALIRENVPQKMAGRAQWNCWDYVWKEDKQKWDKPPLNARTGRGGSTTDPTTWGTLDEALSTAKRLNLAGVGYVFTADDPFVGFDIDACVDAAGGVAEWATAILEDADSYCELSPGDGVKGIVEGTIRKGYVKKPYRAGEPESEFAIYGNGRYFTFTGRRLDDYQIAPEPRQDVVDRWIADIFEQKADEKNEAPGGDGESADVNLGPAIAAMLKLKMKDGSDGSKRLVTWACRAVEHALADDHAILAIRAAALVRPFPKLYTDAEIIQRIRQAERKTERGKHAAGSGVSFDPKYVLMAEIEAKPVSWLWRGVFGLGKLSCVAGDPGLGKSTIMLDFAGRVTTSTPWPDGAPCPIGDVLLLTAEDGLDDTVRPRLDKAGADCSRVRVLQAVALSTTGKERSVTLADVDALRAMLTKYPETKLVIIDPVSAYMSDKDSHNNAEVRGLLAPLAALAEEFGVAIIIVTHLSKGGGSTKAVYRAMGSLGFVAAARAAYMVCKDPGDDTRRLFVPIKNNIGNDRQGYAYRFVGEGDQSRLAWDKDPVPMNADQAIADDDTARGGPKPEKRDEAVEWLRTMLASGPVLVAKLQEEAKAAGMSWITIKRAKAHANVKAEKCSYTHGWQWRMRGTGGAVPPAAEPESAIDDFDDLPDFGDEGDQVEGDQVDREVAGV